MKTARFKYIGGYAALAIVLGTAWVAWSGPEARLTIPASDLIFSHAFHVGEQEIECDACHPAVAASSDAQDKNLPTMDECGECHDIEDDDECGTCHRDPEEPMELTNPIRPIAYNHQVHIEQGIACTRCHGDVAGTETLNDSNLPKMAICLACHDGVRASKDCALCHESRLTLADIHPVEWRHKHGDRAIMEKEYCNSCHPAEEDCLKCHRGDNLTGRIHELNFTFTHGLDAGSKAANCVTCHATRQFCNDCHEANMRLPLRHSTLTWRADHGRFAREDPENCASCHDNADPTCARVGCHSDLDGIIGTDPPIHDPSASRFDSEGDWHDDRGTFCYQCHTNSGQSGIGFCGYCHGAEGD